MKTLDEKAAAKVMDKKEKDADAPMTAPTVDEQVIRSVSRNAPVIAFQMIGDVKQS